MSDKIFPFICGLCFEHFQFLISFFDHLKEHQLNISNHLYNVEISCAEDANRQAQNSDTETLSTGRDSAEMCNLKCSNCENLLPGFCKIREHSFIQDYEDIIENCSKGKVSNYEAASVKGYTGVQKSLTANSDLDNDSNQNGERGSLLLSDSPCSKVEDNNDTEESKVNETGTEKIHKNDHQKFLGKTSIHKQTDTNDLNIEVNYNAVQSETDKYATFINSVKDDHSRHHVEQLTEGNSAGVHKESGKYPVEIMHPNVSEKDASQKRNDESSTASVSHNYNLLDMESGSRGIDNDDTESNTRAIKDGDAASINESVKTHQSLLRGNDSNINSGADDTGNSVHDDQENVPHNSVNDDTENVPYSEGESALLADTHEDNRHNIDTVEEPENVCDNSADSKSAKLDETKNSESLSGGDIIKAHRIRGIRKRRESPKDIKFPCDICGLLFIKKNLQRHRISHTDLKPHKCNVCQKFFKTKDQLYSHKLHHNTRKDLMCHYCGKAFNNGPNLRQHVKIHTREKTLKCPFCPKMFRSNFILKDHVNRHSDTKPYICEHCGKCFRTGNELQRHARVHSNERPHPCSFCDKSFKSRSNRIKHEKTHI